MKMHLLAPSLFVLCLAGSTASAQIKLPIFNEESEGVKNVVFADATQAPDFQHGRLVRVTLKGDDKAIRGTLVRVDGKSGRIFVRTQPGSPPRAFDAKDITKIEKGTIKQVAFTQDVTTPEIQAMVITNGGRRTVTYAAPTLSPGELSILRELEASENSLQEMEHTVARAQLAQDLEFGIQAEHRRAQALQNELYWRQIYDRFETRRMPWIVPITANTSSVRAATAVAVTPEAMLKARQSYLTAQSRLVYESGNLVAVVIDDSK